VRLRVRLDGRAVAEVLADRARADLAGIDGAFAFEVWWPDPPPDDAEVQVEAEDGTPLAGSPARLAVLAGPTHSDRVADAGLPLALVVDEAPPDAARDAGSVALLSHMHALRRLGYAVVFATADEAAAAIRRTAGRVRLAYLHRLRPAALLTAPIRAQNPGVHVVFAVADLAHLRAAREATLFGRDPPPGLRLAELAAAREADAVVTHSNVEAMLLARDLPGVRAHVVPFAMPARPVAVPFAARAGIGFLGNFGHPPNLDAARVLLDAIMPAVWAQAPIPCVLAGRGMPGWLRARASERVQVIDDLPDTPELWSRVRVSAAPLRFGAGVKGKVLDSFAGGIPCVCSPVAAEGLFVPPSLLADGVAATAAALLRLHADAAANAAEAAAGLALLATRHTPAVVERALAWALAPT